MSQTLASIPWTSRDLEALPDNEWVRYEIINGELFITRSPHRRHQQICFRIALQLDTWSESNNVTFSPVRPFRSNGSFKKD